MSKISAIIFSRDRASQLNLLLTSIQKHTRGLFDTTTVIWTCSNHKFADGYSKLIKRYPNVIFDFEGNPDKLLDNSWSTVRSFEPQKFQTAFIENLKVSHDLVCPMVDDDVFYRMPDVSSDAISYMFEFYNNPVFCLRMGRNIVIGDQFTNEPLQLPRIYEVPYTESPNGDIKTFIKWEKAQGHTPWGYPISVDGGIFKKDWLLKRCSEIEFSNPNFLEGNLQRFNDDFKIMLGLPLSSVVGIPVNRVQDIFENRTTNQYTSEELNNLWLDDCEIDLDQLDFSNVNSTHCNLSYKFKDTDV